MKEFESVQIAHATPIEVAGFLKAPIKTGRFIQGGSMKYSGERSNCKTFWFEQDEQAAFGRYWDGTPISEHPSQTEIGDHFEFWIALAQREQKETLQGVFDLRQAQDFQKITKGKDALTVVELAISFWAKIYPHEVGEFLEYVKTKRETLINVHGWTPDKLMKYKGAIPQRVKQLVMLANPELIRLDKDGQSQFDRIFYQLFTRAQIGGN